MQSNDETLESSDTEANTSSKSQDKIRSMTKAETLMLLDLVAKSQILHCKSGKSAAHELKNQEWERISKLFNSRTKTQRSLKQLRLKWDNLKKFARQPANRAKPIHNDIIVRVLDIINNPKTIYESQITNKLMLEIDYYKSTAEVNNVHNDFNVDISQDNEVTEGTIKKAREINKPMTNDETSMLVDLIAKSQVLLCKSGKAAANELKIQEWQRICKLFNSRTKTQRTPKQLRIKWENLKKFAKLQVHKSKHYSKPLNDVLRRVLNLVNNPKPFIPSKINIEQYDSPEIDFWCSNTNDKTLEINNKNQEKAKSMNLHETNILLDLIESSLIFNGAENFSNKVKRLEWCRICNEFNKTKGVTEARTPKQLSYRWDNLKKTAQKQTLTFRHDTIQERVRALLQNRNKSIQSDDEDILSDVNNYVNTSFSDTEMESEPNISEDTVSPTSHSINTTENVKPMSKEDTHVFLDLVDESQILGNKLNNLYTNEMKLKEWRRITNEFNTAVETDHCTVEQLRSKWDNLKDSARKRIIELKIDEKSSFEAFDSVLDRVSSIIEKFERNESNRPITNEEDPLDISNEVSIKVESEQDSDEDEALDHKREIFTRRETKILVTLVRSNKVISNTRNTIYSHEAKQREWRNITRRFNAIALPKVPKNSQQLSMKWENLKKQARKWNAVMKIKKSQICKAKRDKILDNFSSLLADETPTANVAENIISIFKPKKPESDKAKPMTDNETKTLVALIEKSKIIKEYRSTHIGEKMQEWQRITKLFNSAKTTRMHRTLKQLRLKWENLKRSARKHKIMLATDAEAYNHIIRANATLDRVVNILQARDYKQGNINKAKQTKHNTDNKPNKSLETKDYPNTRSKYTADNNIQNISLKTEHFNTFLDIIESELDNSDTVDGRSQFSLEWDSIAKQFSAQIGERKTAERLHTDWCILNETAKNFCKNRQMPTKIPQDILHRVSTIMHKYLAADNNHEVTIGETQNMTFKTEVVYESSEGNSDCGENSTEQMQDFEDSENLKESSSRQESSLSKNTAIAEYFVVKKKIAEAKLNKILLENEKLKIEIDFLKNKEE